MLDIFFGGDTAMIYSILEQFKSELSSKKAFFIDIMNAFRLICPFITEENCFIS